MQGGRVASSGMQDDVDWEISGLHLFAHGPERPLVRQENGTVRLRAGEPGSLFGGAGDAEAGEDDDWSHRGLRRESGLGGGLP